MKKVLVVAVHPDDETLGAGGTLLRHISEGDEVHWMIVTTADSFPSATPEYLENRKKIIKEVAKEFGFKEVHELNLPTTKLDELGQSKIIDQASKVINEVKPEIIYLPFSYDVHSDHRATFDALFSCTKTFRYPFIKTVLMMETLSETEYAPAIPAFNFNPNYFVNITEYFDNKIKIMKLYETELGEHPFPRSIESIEALSTYRGSTSGYKRAESFMLLKNIR